MLAMKKSNFLNGFSLGIFKVDEDDEYGEDSEDGEDGDGGEDGEDGEDGGDDDGNTYFGQN